MSFACQGCADYGTEDDSEEENDGGMGFPVGDFTEYDVDSILADSVEDGMDSTALALK